MAMKMTATHYDTLRTISKLIAPPERLAAAREELRNDPRVKDLEKRLRWDVLYAGVGSQWVCDNLYPYLNDDHIDTAMRQVMREIGA